MADLVDVVVVGGGAGGLAACASVAQKGLTTILVEKESELGGTTLYAIGSITAANTSLQERKGIKDSVDSFYQDLIKGAELKGLQSKCDKRFMELYAKEAGNTANWLADMGVVFYGPSPEPPHSVPRMHNAVPNSYSYIHRLERYSKKHGARMLKSFKVSELLRDSDGRVSGVVGRTSSGDSRRIEAKRAVIIATGPFSSNPELKRRLIPESVDLEGVNPTATGEGVALCMNAGARTKNLDIESAQLRFVGHTTSKTERFAAWWFLPRLICWLLEKVPNRVVEHFVIRLASTHTAPSVKLFHEGAILVAGDGRRFVNELSEPYPHVIARQANALHHKELYIVFDQNLAELFNTWPNYISTFPGIAYAYLSDYEKFRKDILRKAGTVEELAQQAGINPDNLKSTISQYNNFAADMKDRDFGRPTLCAIRNPPFFALGPVRPVITVTEGGIAINAKCQVLDGQDKVVPGLFAVGDGTAGPLNVSHGMHLGWALTSGRLAAESILE